MNLKQVIAGLVMVSSGTLASASDGLQSVNSKHSVAQTMDRLEEIVKSAEFKVFVRVDHSAGAKSVDMELRPTQLLIFGKPQAGSVLMQSDQRMGIDLPVKYLVWQDEAGQVKIEWNDPAWVAARHGVTDKAPVVGKMSGALNKMATKAAGE